MSTLFWGYFSRISSIASSLIIMPFALAQFSSEAFSLWMVFVVFYGLIVVFDFGLTTTISRQYNYLLAGANTIEEKGISQISTGEINEKLFTQLYLSSKTIFSTIALVVGLLLIAVYFFYLQPITQSYSDNIVLEWILYGIAIVIGLFCLTYNAIFFGTNNVASIYRVCSVSNLIFFGIAITLILLDYGLLAIAVARVVSALVYFIHARLEIKTLKMLAHYKTQYKSSHGEVLKSLLPNAAKLGGVTLGNFLVSKASVLIVAAYFPLSESGSYSLALNIFSVIMSVSLLFMTIKTPTLNKLRQEQKNAQVVALQSKIRLVCLATGTVGFFAFISLGEPLLTLIGSTTPLPALSVLLIFTSLCFLEVNRLISMNFIMSSNQVPFLKAALATGVASIMAIILLFEIGYTMMVIPVLIQLLLQSLFNNWYWTKQEFSEYKSFRN